MAEHFSSQFLNRLGEHLMIKSISSQEEDLEKEGDESQWNQQDLTSYNGVPKAVTL